MMRGISLVFLCIGMACAGAAAAESLILVATPQLRNPLYGRTVLVVSSFGERQHFGFIVNRPLDTSLGKIFPNHPPSQKVAKPVFLGGPTDVAAIFALVAGDEAPGEGCVSISPGLFAVFHRNTLDRVIEANPARARFFAGLVVWRPGELQHELARGAWYVLPADAQLALREPGGLWEELVVRSVRASELHSTAIRDAPAAGRR